MGEGEDSQHQEVEGEQHVDVLLAKDVEDHVEAKECAGGDEREHHGVLLRHRLRSLSSSFVIILLLLLRVNTPEAATICSTLSKAKFITAQCSTAKEGDENFDIGVHLPRKMGMRAMTTRLP